MGDKILSSIISGTPVPGSDWSAFILFKLNIGALIPQLTAFLNSLFPQKIAASTVEQGEAPDAAPAAVRPGHRPGHRDRGRR